MGGAHGLCVDQAIKSLCDIWHPEDIPHVFRMAVEDLSSSSSAANDKAITPGEIPLMSLPLRNTQLPSPVSPDSQSIPFDSPPITLNASPSGGCIRTDNLLPIRGFVHEVLRRSRTSTGVLQTALCYLEAVRSKVPGILEKEQMRQAHPELFEEEDPSVRIVLGTTIGADNSQVGADPLCACLDMQQNAISDVVDTCPQEPLTAPPTEIIADSEVAFNNPPPLCCAASKIPAAPLAPLPPSPSPLLCPRRTFLACLILASKFMQDRSYSNKAWAKLAGLPPREIGRCERALGEALEWRLWVGKGSSVAGTTSTAHRAVTRCRTDLVIRTPTCAWPTPTAPVSMYASSAATLRAGGRSLSGLRRSATMPNIESNSCNEELTCTQPEIRLLDTTAQPPIEATLVAEPDMDDFTAPGHLPPFAAWAAPSVQASLYAGELLSPATSTPGLVYSPMSTSSTVSSDDGDRTVNMPFRHTPSHLSSSCEIDSVGSKAGIPADHSPWAMFHGNRLAPIDPTVNGPVHLPPLLEAVYNPILVERTVGNHPDFLGSYNRGGPANNAYNSSFN
jgi:PHO85 cyclin-5